jgi:transposase-like protein
MYGPAADRFARFRCPECETSYPERSQSILRQLAEVDYC